MNILVICPMEVEQTNFKIALSQIEHRHTYRVVHCGIGKVNAAVTTALELYGSPKGFTYDLVAVIGYAGGSSRLKQGELVIPSKACFHDVVGPKDLIPELLQVYNLQGSDNVAVLTGDSFVTKENVHDIAQHNPGCQAVLYDMESAAVCQVADEIPVLVMKLVSDNPSSTNSLQSFEDFVKTHSNFSQFVHYLEALE